MSSKSTYKYLTQCNDCFEKLYSNKTLKTNFKTGMKILKECLTKFKIKCKNHIFRHIFRNKIQNFFKIIYFNKKITTQMQQQVRHTYIVYFIQKKPLNVE